MRWTRDDYGAVSQVINTGGARQQARQYKCRHRFLPRQPLRARRLTGCPNSAAILHVCSKCSARRWYAAGPSDQIAELIRLSERKDDFDK